jgi:hypothetical protein
MVHIEKENIKRKIQGSNRGKKCREEFQGPYREKNKGENPGSLRLSLTDS